MTKREKREGYYDPAPPDSPRHYQKWTAAEDALVAAGTETLRVLATVLQRSMKAVELRRAFLRRAHARDGKEV